MSKIIVRVQTADEEFDHLMQIFGEMDFYNKYGYNVTIPDHPFFLDISNDLDLLNSLDLKKARNIFNNEVYDSHFFEKSVKSINKDIVLVETIINQMKKWQNWNFKIFSKYTVRLTAYGPGGSYDPDKGDVVIKIDENGEFNEIPQHTIIHEIVHIGIEKSIIKKFELTHVEKEELVDSICANCFNNLLTNYKIQDFGDKKVFNLASKDNIMELPKIVKECKNKMCSTKDNS